MAERGISDIKEIKEKEEADAEAKCKEAEAEAAAKLEEERLAEEKFVAQ